MPDHEMDKETPPVRSTGGIVSELAQRDRVRDLASFLGLDAEAVAEGLLDAVVHDPSLRQNENVHHAA